MVGVKVQFHEFLSSALDGGEWSASDPGSLNINFFHSLRN